MLGNSKVPPMVSLGQASGGGETEGLTLAPGRVALSFTLPKCHSHSLLLSPQLPQLSGKLPGERWGEDTHKGFEIVLSDKGLMVGRGGGGGTGFDPGDTG